MRIWVDLSNSPHAPFFAPLVRRFDRLGHDVLLTARDHAQTVELARAQWGDRVAVVDSPARAGALGKALGLAARSSHLRRWAKAARPDLALSHNSYSQIVAARLCRTTTVTAMDYEHQPMNHLAFRLADRIFLPRAVSPDATRRQGARNGKVPALRRIQGRALPW